MIRVLCLNPYWLDLTLNDIFNQVDIFYDCLNPYWLDLTLRLEGYDYPTNLV